MSKLINLFTKSDNLYVPKKIVSVNILFLERKRENPFQLTHGEKQIICS
jgi:hypothetical protein